MKGRITLQQRSELMALLTNMEKKPTIPKRRLPERDVEVTVAHTIRAIGMDIEEIESLVSAHKKLYPHTREEGSPTAKRAWFRKQVGSALRRYDGPSTRQRQTFIARMLAEVEQFSTFKPE